MSENLSLDDTIAKLKLDAQEALKKVILDNKQKWETNLQNRQQHLIEKLNPNLIKINVGGHKFVTTLETLTKIPETRLHKMVTGRYPILLDKKDRIFIDRNGQYFGYVLDCLRKGQVELPSDPFLSGRVQREYEYFELVSKEVKKEVKKEEQKVVPSNSFGSGFGSNPFAQNIQVSNISQVQSSNIAQGNHSWKLALQTEGIIGGKSDGITAGVPGRDQSVQIIGDTVLSSGTYWRFLIEEMSHLFQQKIPDEFSEDDENYYDVSFGVVTKKTWKKIKEDGDFFLIVGFNTQGEVFKADYGTKKNKGLKIDGPDEITTFDSKNQEVTILFNAETGIMKLKVKNAGIDCVIRINGSAENEYYPYFHLDNTKVTLLETRALTEAENAEMIYVESFKLKKNSDDDDEDDEEEEGSDDYEDVSEESY